MEQNERIVEQGDKTRARWMTRGGWNLALLALVAIMITLSLTTVSMAIYHYSGDIYLDRSRPGYLPDTEEVETEEETEEGVYSF